MDIGVKFGAMLSVDRSSHDVRMTTSLATVAGENYGERPLRPPPPGSARRD
jgi:hypothetical protein